jgi:single-strand DNA-binding protein
MSGYNKVILKGVLGADAEVKTLESGVNVATISVAVNKSYSDKTTGEKKYKVEWFRVEAWKELATFLGTYGKKGTELLIDGELKNETWEKDGHTHRAVKIVAKEIVFVGSKSSTAAPAQAAPAQAAPAQAAPAQVAPAQVAPATAVSSSEFMSGMQNGVDDDMPF